MILSGTQTINIIDFYSFQKGTSQTPEPRKRKSLLSALSEMGPVPQDAYKWPVENGNSEQRPWRSKLTSVLS